MITDQKFKVNEQVLVKTGLTKQLGIIQSADLIRGNWRYSVLLNSMEEVEFKEIYLTKFSKEPSPIANLDNSLIGNFFSFLCGITLKRLDVSLKLTNNYYSVNSTRTQFYPHQLKPLIKFIDSENESILICDEVGLGKTIEAGIILKELIARESDSLKNVIIVCPSSLREKWWNELYEKFQCDFEILDSSLRFITQFKKENAKKHVIVSYETIRSKKVSDFLNDKESNLIFDLVIFDEAHWMKNRTSEQHKVGKTIATLSERKLLLTATPIQMRENDLYTLLNLLDENEYADKDTFDTILELNKPLVKAQSLLNRVDFSHHDLKEHLSDFKRLSYNYGFKYDSKLVRKITEMLKIHKSDYNQILKIQENLTKLNLISQNYTRTRKLDVTENKVVRNAIKVSCKFEELEKIYYNKITKIIRDIILEYNKHNQPIPHGWIKNNYQRQITSSILAFIRKRTKGLAETNDSEIYDNDDYFDYEEGLEIKERLNHAIRNNDDFKEIEQILLKKDCDSKIKETQRILSEILKKNKHPKIMLFSFFKPTLKVLEEKLSKGNYKVFRIDGDVKREERTPIVNEFAHYSKPAILLSSKIGTEGQDYQFCDILINYDLPWNPMELEQRIGRLDRIGQKAEKIHIYNLYYEESIEDRILLRLYDRIGIFENSIGGLEDIINTEIEELKDIYNPVLTDEEKFRILELNEKAILNKQILQKEADERVEEMLGLDEYFTNKIKKIKNNKQYITPKQLSYIISDFFENKFKHSLFKYDLTTNIGQFKIDSDFRSFINQQIASNSSFNDKEKDTLRNLNRKTSIKITLDGITANENLELEFMNSFHPLVKIIKKFYDEEVSSQKVSNTYRILLESNDIKPGYYFLFTTVMNAKAYSIKNILTTIIIDAEGKELMTDDYGMDMLSFLLENGQDCPIHHPFTDEKFKEINNRFREIIAERVDELEQEFIADAERAYEKKKLYIKRTIDRKIDREKQIVENLKQKVADDFSLEKNNLPIINIHETKIDKLTSNREKRINELNEKFENKSCSYDNTNKIIGILKVEKPT